MIKSGDIVRVDIINNEDESFDKIIKNKENTWQPERTTYDKMKDGVLDKRGEFVFQAFFKIQ